VRKLPKTAYRKGGTLREIFRKNWGKRQEDDEEVKGRWGKEEERGFAETLVGANVYG